MNLDSPGANVIKLFSSTLAKWPSKLQCLPWKTLQLSLIFSHEATSLPLRRIKKCAQLK